MELSPEQLHAIHQGAMIPIFIGQAECLIVRKDVYERSLSEADPRPLYASVLNAWDADDDNPAQYQEYLDEA